MKVKPNLNEVELVPARMIAGQSLCTGCVFHYPAHWCNSVRNCMTSDTRCVKGNSHLIWKEKVNAEA